MPAKPTLSLIVLRVADIERSAAFYTSLGLNFTREKHGAGPEHFSTWVGETVFELYPASERFPVTTVRLGFVVESIATVLDEWRVAGGNVLSEPQNSPYGLRAVVADPDGHRVELTQIPEPQGIKQKLLEVYSEDSNYAVVKLPDRQNPGVVIQGDSLSILCDQTKRIAEAVRDNQTDSEDFPYDVEALLHSLVGRLHHYQSVLQEHGHKLPFSSLVTDADYIKLIPENDAEL